MNKNLIELNDNYGMSIDEDGNVTMITKDKKDYKFKEILEKENEIELLNDDLDLLNKELDIKKFDLKICRIVNVVTIFAISFFGFITYDATASIESTLLIGAASGAFMRIMPLGASGTTFGNKKKIKKITNKISEIENKIPVLEKELNNIKAKANYMTLTDSSENVSLNNNYQFTSFNEIEHNNTEEKTISKVKVLSLKK